MSSEKDKEDSLNYSGGNAGESFLSGTDIDWAMLSNVPVNKEPFKGQGSAPDPRAQPQTMLGMSHDTGNPFQQEIELQPTGARMVTSSEDLSMDAIRGQAPLQPLRLQAPQGTQADIEAGYIEIPNLQQVGQFGDIFANENRPLLDHAPIQTTRIDLFIGGVTLLVLLALAVISAILAYRQPSITMNVLLYTTVFATVVCGLFMVWVVNLGATVNRAVRPADTASRLGLVLTFVVVLLAGMMIALSMWMALYREVHFDYLVGLGSNKAEWENKFNDNVEAVIKVSSSLLWWAIGLLATAGLLLGTISNITLGKRYHATRYTLYWSTLWLMLSAWLVIYWICESIEYEKLIQNTQELDKLVKWLKILAGLGAFLSLLTTFANLLKIRAIHICMTVILVFYFLGTAVCTAMLWKELLKLQGQEKYFGNTTTCVYTMQTIHEDDYMSELCPIDGGKYLPVGQVASKTFLATRWENGNFDEVRSLNPACCLTAKFIEQWPFMQLSIWGVVLCVATFITLLFNSLLISTWRYPEYYVVTKTVTLTDIIFISLTLLVSAFWCLYFYLHVHEDRGGMDPFSQLKAFIDPKNNVLRNFTTVPRSIVSEAATKLSVDYRNGTVCFNYDVDNMPFPSFVTSSPDCGDVGSCSIRVAIASKNAKFIVENVPGITQPTADNRLNLFPNCDGAFKDYRMIYGTEQQVRNYLRNLKICTSSLTSIPSLAFYKDQALVADPVTGLKASESLITDNKTNVSTCLQGFSNESSICNTAASCKYFSPLYQNVVLKTLKGRLYYMDKGEKIYQVSPSVIVFAYSDKAMIGDSYVLFDNGYFAIRDIPVFSNSSYIIKLAVVDNTNVFINKSIEFKVSPSNHALIGVGEIRLNTKNGNLCVPGTGSCENQPRLNGRIKLNVLEGSYKSIASKSMSRLGNVTVMLVRNFTSMGETALIYPTDENGNVEISNMEYGSYTINVTKPGYLSILKYIDLQEPVYDIGKIILDPESEDRDAVIAGDIRSESWDYDLILHFTTLEGATCEVSPYFKFCGYAAHANDASFIPGEEKIYIRRLTVATYNAFIRVVPPYNATCDSCDEILSHENPGLNWGHVEASSPLDSVNVQSLFYNNGRYEADGDDVSSFDNRDDNSEVDFSNATIVNYMGVSLLEGERFKRNITFTAEDNANRGEISEVKASIVPPILLPILQNRTAANDTWCSPYLLSCFSNINCEHPPLLSENCEEDYKNSSLLNGVNDSKIQRYILHEDRLYDVVNFTSIAGWDNGSVGYSNYTVYSYTEGNISSNQREALAYVRSANVTIFWEASIVNITKDLIQGSVTNWSTSNSSELIRGKSGSEPFNITSRVWYNSTTNNSTDTNLTLYYNTTTFDNTSYLINESRTNSTLNGSIREFDFSITNNNTTEDMNISEIYTLENRTDSNNTTTSTKNYSINVTRRPEDNQTKVLTNSVTSEVDTKYSNLTLIRVLHNQTNETFANSSKASHHSNSTRSSWPNGSESMQILTLDQQVNDSNNYANYTTNETWSVEKSDKEPAKNTTIVSKGTVTVKNGSKTTNHTISQKDFNKSTNSTIIKSQIKLEENGSVSEINRTEELFENGTNHTIEIQMPVAAKGSENERIVRTIDTWSRGENHTNTTENLMNLTYYPANQSLVVLQNLTVSINGSGSEQLTFSMGHSQTNFISLYDRVTSPQQLTITKPKDLKNTITIELTLQAVGSNKEEEVKYLQSLRNNLTTLMDKNDDYFKEMTTHDLRVNKTSFKTIEWNSSDNVSLTKVDNQTTRVFNPYRVNESNLTLLRTVNMNLSSEPLNSTSTKVVNSTMEIFVNLTDESTSPEVLKTALNTSMINNRTCTFIQRAKKANDSLGGCTDNGTIFYSKNGDQWRLEYFNQTNSLSPEAKSWTNRSNLTNDSGIVNSSLIGGTVNMGGFKSDNFSEHNHTVSTPPNGSITANTTKVEGHNVTEDERGAITVSSMKDFYSVNGYDNKNITRIESKFYNTTQNNSSGVPTNETVAVSYSIKNVANLKPGDADLKYYTDNPVDLNGTQKPMENCSVLSNYEFIKQYNKNSSQLFQGKHNDYLIKNHFVFINRTSASRGGNKSDTSEGCNAYSMTNSVSNYSKMASFDTSNNLPVYVTNHWTISMLDKGLSNASSPSTEYSENIKQTTRIEAIPPQEYRDSKNTSDLEKSLPRIEGRNAKNFYVEQRWRLQNKSADGMITRESSYTANTTITNNTGHRPQSDENVSEVTNSDYEPTPLNPFGNSGETTFSADSEEEDIQNDTFGNKNETIFDPEKEYTKDRVDSTLTPKEKEPSMDPEVESSKDHYEDIVQTPKWAVINESNNSNYSLNASGFENLEVNITYVDVSETPTCRNCATEFVFRRYAQNTTNQSLKNPEKYNGTTKQYTSLVDEMRWRGHPRVEGVVYEKNVGEYLLMNYPSNSTTDETTNTSYIMIIEGNITNGTVQLVENTSKEVEPRFVGAVYRNEKPTASRQSVDDLEDLDVLTNVSNYTRNIRYSGEESKRLKYFLTNKGSLRVQRANSTSNFNQTVYEFYEFDYIDENPKNFIKSCIVENTSVEYPVLEFNTTLLTYTYTNSCQQNPKTASMPGNGSKLEYADKTEYTLKYFYNCTWNEKPLVLHQKTSRTLVVTSADGKQSFTNLAKPELIDKDVTPDVEENCEADQAAP